MHNLHIMNYTHQKTIEKDTDFQTKIQLIIKQCIKNIKFNIS